MYEIDSAWREFYTTEDPVKRGDSLDRLLSSGEYGEEYALAKELFNRRHFDKKLSLGEVDRFLFNCVMLINLYRSGNFFKRSNKKEVTKMMEDMGCLDCTDEQSETLVYWEMRNSVARYLKTCQAPTYRRKLFGLMGSSDDDKQFNMISDVWKMSVGISEKFHMESEMRVWNQAVRDQFSMCYDGAARDLDEFNPKTKKK